MKNKLFLSILLCITAFHSAAQNEDVGKDTSPNKFFNIGVIPPICTNGEDKYIHTNNFSFNLLSTQAYNIKGITISGISNIIHNNAYGIQIAGLVNRVGYTEDKSWPPNLSSYINGKGKGLAIAGLGNTFVSYDGVQIAAFNGTRTLNGLQIGLMDYAEQMNGLQIGFAASSSITNGIQIGMFTTSEQLRGVQIGIFNEKKTDGGVQLGIINTATRNNWPIGIINIIEDGDKKIGLTIDEIANTIISFRSGGRYLYGIVGMGYNFKSKYNHMAIEAGIGAHMHFSKKFRIDTELAVTGLTRPQIQFGHKDEEDDDWDFKIMAKYGLRILPAFKVSNKIELFAGPTLNYMYSKPLENRHIFPSTYLWRDFGNSSLKQLNIGAMIGAQYIF